MESAKPPWKSLGAIAGFIAVLSSAAVAAGLLTPEQGTLITTNGPEIAAQIIAAVSAAFGLWGRLRAKEKISL